MSEPALRLTKYSFSLGSRGILRELSFSVAAGERVAVIGPNGAGKSTLLKCLCRILKGGRGQIQVAGRPLESYGQPDLARRLAYVPQVEGKAASFTVREMVEMARYPHLGPLAPMQNGDAAAVERALEDTGMRALAARSMNTLSGGERQKALLAAALAQQADILLLDEPTTFLDPFQQVEMLRVLGRVQRDRSSAILSVTHDLNEALGHSERVIALREGALVFDGPAARLAEGESLRWIYGHEFVVGAHPRTGRPVLFPE
jgi:iron complex transport system ATP-binding protein